MHGVCETIGPNVVDIIDWFYYFNTQSIDFNVQKKLCNGQLKGFCVLTVLFVRPTSFQRLSAVSSFYGRYPQFCHEMQLECDWWLMPQPGPAEGGDPWCIRGRKREARGGQGMARERNDDQRKEGREGR